MCAEAAAVKVMVYGDRGMSVLDENGMKPSRETRKVLSEGCTKNVETRQRIPAIHIAVKGLL